jgi:hypothetical protein
MPVLANERHELFAQGLAQGKTADEAYVEAGFKANRGNATRMKADERILARVAELLSRAATGVVISRQRVLEELAALGFASLEPGGAIKDATKRAALMDIAKLEGWVIERSETGKPGDFDRMTDDELDGFIQTRTRGIGVGPTGKAKTH